MTKKYGAILADPPWLFETYSAKGKGRSAERHYRCMSFKDILALEIPAAEDCVLFLWVTDPYLEKAMGVINAWGFKYKTVAFTWVKTNKSDEPWTGMGFWTRANPEQCLLATRGHPSRVRNDVAQLIIAPRREHSRKPDEIYHRIERLVAGPYLELFARQRRDGWDATGDEIDKFAGPGA